MARQKVKQFPFQNSMVESGLEIETKTNNKVYCKFLYQKVKTVVKTILSEFITFGSGNCWVDGRVLPNLLLPVDRVVPIPKLYRCTMLSKKLIQHLLECLYAPLPARNSSLKSPTIF